MKKQLSNFDWVSHDVFFRELLAAIGFVDIKAIGKRGEPVSLNFQANYPVEISKRKVEKQLWLIEVNSTSRVSVDTLARLAAMTVLKGAFCGVLIITGKLTSASKAYAKKINANFNSSLRIWDRDFISPILEKLPDLREKYTKLTAEFPNNSIPRSSKHLKLVKQLTECPLGQKGWRDYERICIDILTEVFVPPLKPPRIQPRTLSGLERRDTLFSLRGGNAEWQAFRQEFDANFLLCEFKNYSRLITKDEVNQTRNYLRETIGRVGIIFSRKGPDDGALRMRNSIFAQERKVILFFTDDHLVELLQLKAANQSTLDLIQDTIDDYYIAQE